MKLEKYLADYLDQELEILECAVISDEMLQEVIKQGLDAFENAENVTIEIKSGKPESHRFKL